MSADGPPCARLRDALALIALASSALAENCFAEVLSALASPDCMHREDLSANISTPSLNLSMSRVPIYVMHAPMLVQRHAHMRQQLKRLAATDVTWVLCANRDAVNALTARQRACAYPCVQLNQWHARNSSTGEPLPLKNGTLSLALKHKLACYDMLERHLTAALILEDDAILPSDLWAQMARSQIPGDADVFWMGSYTRSKAWDTLKNHPTALPGTKIHRRNMSVGGILGTTSYVMFASGARILLAEPVTTAADIAISFSPRPGVAHSLSHGRDAHHGKSKRTFDDGTCEGADGQLYMQRPPPKQYGPREWIIWPIPNSGPGGIVGLTHLYR